MVAVAQSLPSVSRARMIDLLGTLARGQGFSASNLPGVKFMRSSSYVPPTPVAYEPSIVLIAQGRKRGVLGGRVYPYDANHYLVLTLPVPFECETFGLPEEPLLGLSIGVTAATIAGLLAEMEIPAHDAHDSGSDPRAIDSAEVEEPLCACAVRLLEALQFPEDARILGPQLVRELIYRVLRGPLGGNLRGLAAPRSHFGQIGRVLHRIHTQFAKGLDIDTLAREAGMSVSTFHSHFKAVTASSPLQYIKTIRLHKARLMMVHDGIGAAEAALQVGYESASQFSREFKRLFGAAPAAAAAQLRASFTRLA
jgi:AraC-like DNA-binding protein